MAIEYPDYKWWIKSVPRENKWTDVNNTRLLKLYRTYSYLWDSRQIMYRNRMARTKAFREIALALKLKNVDENQCMKQVERLKKRYLAEKELYDDSEKKSRPKWFCIMEDIVWRVLHPQKIVPNVTSYEVCDACCKDQCRQMPCDRYRELKGITSSFQLCKECCARQNQNAPCCYYTVGEAEIEAGKRYCEQCARQYWRNECEGLAPPAEDKSKNIVTINMETCFSRMNEAEDECPCMEGDVCYGDDSSGDHDDDDDDNYDDDDSSDFTCSCNDYSASRTSSETSKQNFCQDIETLQALLETCSLAKEMGLLESPEDVSEHKELWSDDVVTEKRGLFAEAKRASGKKITLLKPNDREPRRHFAIKRSQQCETYPLQLEM